MKKTLTLLAAAVAVTFNALGQQASTLKPFTHNNILSEIENSEDKNYSISSAKHNAQSRRAQETSHAQNATTIKQKLDSLVSPQRNKRYFLYDTQGQVILDSYYYWSDSIWVPNTKYTLTYDNLGNNTEYILHIWDSNINDWTFLTKRIATYNSSGQQTQRILYRWFNNEWTNRAKEDITYNNSGDLINSITYKFNNNAWVALEKYEYEYNSSGNATIKMSYVADTSGWYNSSKSEYSYNSAGNNTLTLYYIRDNNNWANSGKYEYDYDTLGNITLDSYYEWDTATTSWTGFSKSTLNYNLAYSVSDLIAPDYFFTQSVNMIDYAIDYNWNTISNAWDTGNTTTYYYSPQEVTGVHDNKKSVASLYPVPTKDVLHVVLTNNAAQATIELYDLQGRSVLTQNLENTSKVLVNDLNAGMYFYRISTGNGKVQSGKFVKE